MEMMNIRILRMEIQTFFMANLDYTAAAASRGGSGSSAMLYVSSGH